MFDYVVCDCNIRCWVCEICIELGNLCKILFGVDWFDYIKGIDVWLKVFFELLVEGCVKCDDIVLV